MPRFRDRREAGRMLAEELADVARRSAVVLGIPRGGVVVAHEIAERLGGPLDVLVVRKLGYPGHEEAGFGARRRGGRAGAGGARRARPGDPRIRVVQAAIAEKRAEVEEQIRRYRGERPARSDRGRHRGRGRRRHRDRLHVRGRAGDRRAGTGRGG